MKCPVLSISGAQSQALKIHSVNSSVTFFCSLGYDSYYLNLIYSVYPIFVVLKIVTIAPPIQPAQSHFIQIKLKEPNFQDT